MFTIKVSIINEAVQHNQMLLDCRAVWKKRLKNLEKNCLFNLSNGEFCRNSYVSKNVFNTTFEQKFSSSQHVTIIVHFNDTENNSLDSLDNLYSISVSFADTANLSFL